MDSSLDLHQLGQITQLQFLHPQVNKKNGGENVIGKYRVRLDAIKTSNKINISLCIDCPLCVVHT